MTELTDLHTSFGAMAPDYGIEPDARARKLYGEPVRAVEPMVLASVQWERQAVVEGMRHYTVEAVGPQGQQSSGVFPAASMVAALAEAERDCAPFGWRVVSVAEGIAP